MHVAMQGRPTRHAKELCVSSPAHHTQTWAKGDKGPVERAPSSVVRLKPAVESLTRRYRIEHRGLR
jgi:hypothetical protein